MVEPVEEPDEVLVDHAMSARDAGEVRALRLGREGAAEEKVPTVHHVAVFGELLDGIAAIQKAALVAVDEGDGGGARRGRVEAGIVRAHRVVGIESTDVQERRAHGVRQHGENDLAAVWRARRGRDRRVRWWIPTRETCTDSGEEVPRRWSGRAPGRTSLASPGTPSLGSMVYLCTSCASRLSVRRVCARRYGRRRQQRALTRMTVRDIPSRVKNHALCSAARHRPKRNERRPRRGRRGPVGSHDAPRTPRPRAP